jgi:chromosome partitioning protein
MVQVICVTNQKGGVGKTTTAVNLSYYLAKDKFRVLLIDFDPQGNATSGLGIEKTDTKTLGATMAEVVLGTAKLEQIIRPTKYKNFSLAPTTPELANVEVEMANMQRKFVRLRDAIHSVAANYDYIIIDSPPSLSLLTVNGMIASNFLLLPVQTEFYALEGVAQLLESMKLVMKQANPNLRLLGVLATMYDKRTSLSAQVYAEIKKYFKQLTFETTIPRNVRVAEAPSHGVPVGVYDKFSKGAKAYKEFAKEVEERTKNG